MTQLTTELRADRLTERKTAPSDRMTGQVVFGLLIVVLMFGGIAGWAIGTRIEGAVVAPGMVAVESNRKTVQHLEGGIVGEIHVQEGDYAKAGQLLMRLDDTLTQANLAIVVNQQTDFLAQRARLTAELTDRDAVEYPPQLLERTAESEGRGNDRGAGSALYRPPRSPGGGSGLRPAAHRGLQRADQGPEAAGRRRDKGAQTLP